MAQHYSTPVSFHHPHNLLTELTAHTKISLFNFAYEDTGGALDHRINSFANSARQNFTAVSGFPQPEIYVSYGHGNENLDVLYSAKKLPRLRSLKAKWDPKNVYQYNYPITP